MDAIDFIQGIKCEDFQSSVINYFDQNMMMYNLIGHYKDIGITAGHDQVCITYTIHPDQADNINALILSLTSVPCILYDKVFSIQITQTNDELIITMKETTSES